MDNPETACIATCQKCGFSFEADVWYGHCPNCDPVHKHLLDKIEEHWRAMSGESDRMLETLQSAGRLNNQRIESGDANYDPFTDG